MGLKSIILRSKNDDILYRVACHIYNIEKFPVKKIEIINRHKAIIFYTPFKVEMRRDYNAKV